VILCRWRTHRALCRGAMGDSPARSSTSGAGGMGKDPVELAGIEQTSIQVVKRCLVMQFCDWNVSGGGLLP
jgi:hypothetical protein